MSTTTESTKVLDTTLQLETDDQSTSWLANIFRPFLMPFDGSSGEPESSDRFDWRFLGVSSLKSSTYGVSEVSFFQIIGSSLKQNSSLSVEAGEGESYTSSPSTTSRVSTQTNAGGVSKMEPQQYHSTKTNEAYTTSMSTNNTIVMALNTQVFKPSKRQLYYIFPCDAIVETVNETPPYESPPISRLLDNQQGYTDIPSSSLLLTVATDVKTEQPSISASTTNDESSITHLSLSGISQELYMMIKDSVAGFETAYGKMIQLMKFHTEGVSHRHAELLVVGGNNGTRSKKPTADPKTSRGKRKGSYQQRQTSPRTATAPAITPTTSNLSNKAKSASDSNTTSPKQPLSSPPMSSHVATTSSSAPIIPSGTASSTSAASHRHNSANGNGRKCHYCGSKSTPMWRRGPEGAGTLCNACGQSGSETALGSASTPAPTPTSTKSANGYSASKVLTTKEQKKRKQHDKRIKIKEQQQQRLKQHKPHSWQGNTMILDSMIVTDDEDEDDDDEEDDDNDDDQNGIDSSGFSDDDDFMGEYDDDDGEDEDERMNSNIVAARHLTIHEGQQHHHHQRHPYHDVMPTGLTPQPQSRSRSMTTSAANDYLQSHHHQQQLQQQQQQQQQQQHYQQNGWPMPNGFHHNQQQPYPYQQQPEEQQHRPRRHTTDISVLDQVPWGEFPLSMGVDAVEAATVLTLLKRS
ncbi:hypothetical protein BCR42DRAFT_407618 [Absidia repens]|uniref:GATA-type domain-containing protein n=1 Tax=Absidia repens TaxID=90262 RepID=A0A1X2ISF8_9FUNG|nr:hypothetical protein BCR42DRAFT_407618 [Absidia repens]